MELMRMLAGIDRQKAILDRRRPLPAATARSIHEAVRLEWTCHSIALEGNTLTLREVEVVLEGLTVGGGKTLKEHLEAVITPLPWTIWTPWSAVRSPSLR